MAHDEQRKNLQSNHTTKRNYLIRSGPKQGAEGYCSYYARRIAGDLSFVECRCELERSTWLIFLTVNAQCWQLCDSRHVYQVHAFVCCQLIMDHPIQRINFLNHKQSALYLFRSTRLSNISSASRYSQDIYTSLMCDGDVVFNSWIGPLHVV